MCQQKLDKRKGCRRGGGAEHQLGPAPQRRHRHDGRGLITCGRRRRRSRGRASGGTGRVGGPVVTAERAVQPPGLRITEVPPWHRSCSAGQPWPEQNEGWVRTGHRVDVFEGRLRMSHHVPSIEVAGPSSATGRKKREVRG